MCDAVNKSLYGDATNPFSQRRFCNLPDSGRDIVRDPFVPTDNRPNVNLTTLMRMGIINRDPWLLGETQERGTTRGGS